MHLCQKWSDRVIDMCQIILARYTYGKRPTLITEAFTKSSYIKAMPIPSSRLFLFVIKDIAVRILIDTIA